MVTCSGEVDDTSVWGPTLGEENKDTLVQRGCRWCSREEGRNVLTAGAEVQSLGSEQRAAAEELN